MLADISGSCRAMTSLALTYMGLMHDVFPGGCHQFVFVNSLVPVDSYFSSNGVRQAVEEINSKVPSRGIYSDYGKPLRQLVSDYAGIINKDTIIVLLGDCRNNKNDPAMIEVEWLVKRTKKFFVLNPDDLHKWGTGDSITDMYINCGAKMAHVSTTRELLDFAKRRITQRRITMKKLTTGELMQFLADPSRNALEGPVCLDPEEETPDSYAYILKVPLGEKEHRVDGIYIKYFAYDDEPLFSEMRSYDFAAYCVDGKKTVFQQHGLRYCSTILRWLCLQALKG